MREVIVHFRYKKTWIVYGTDCGRGRDPWKFVSVAQVFTGNSRSHYQKKLLLFLNDRFVPFSLSS